MVVRRGVRYLLAVLIVASLLILTQRVYIQGRGDDVQIVSSGEEHKPLANLRGEELSQKEARQQVRLQDELHGNSTESLSSMQHTSTNEAVDEATASSQEHLPGKTVTEDDKRVDKVVVVGKTVQEDASWIENELPDWRGAVYSVDNVTAPLHTKQNKGREANAYLTYIVDHYDRLPDIVAFIHPHKDGYPIAWHNDQENYSNVDTLKLLNLDFLRKEGYINLRCNPIPGCPDEIQPFREWDDQHRTAEHAYGQIWRDLFNSTDVPRQVGAACCAQFAVTKEQILKRPRADYVWYLEYLLASTLPDADLGRVYEYLWHVIFGREAVHCPEVKQCYLDLYNRVFITDS